MLRDVAVAAPSVRLKGTREIAYDFQYKAGGGGYRATATQSSFAQSERPLRVNVGVGYDKQKSFAVAGDVQWYAARAEADGEAPVLEVGKRLGAERPAVEERDDLRVGFRGRRV